MDIDQWSWRNKPFLKTTDQWRIDVKMNRKLNILETCVLKILDTYAEGAKYGRRNSNHHFNFWIEQNSTGIAIKQ